MDYSITTTSSANIPVEIRNVTLTSGLAVTTTHRCIVCGEESDEPLCQVDKAVFMYVRSKYLEQIRLDLLELLEE